MSKFRSKSIAIIILLIMSLNMLTAIVSAESDLLSGNIVDLIDEHNSKYLSIHGGDAIGYNKKTKSDEVVSIGKYLSMAKSEMSFPLDEKYYSISSDFGVRRHPFTGTNGAKEIHSLPFHAALDIAAANIKGADIYSVMGGVVSQVSRNVNSYGNLVVVDHGGLYTYYAHMDAIDAEIEVGVEVDAGDILGQVGSTGRSTGPHLHIEFIVGDAAINPRIFLEGGFEVSEKDIVVEKPAKPEKPKQPIKPEKEEEKIVEKDKKEEIKVKDFTLKALGLDNEDNLDDNLDTININSVLDMENSFLKLEFDQDQDINKQDYENIKLRVLPLDKQLGNVGKLNNKNIINDRFKDFKALTLDKGN